MLEAVHPTYFPPPQTQTHDGSQTSPHAQKQVSLSTVQAGSVLQLQ